MSQNLVRHIVGAEAADVPTLRDHAVDGLAVSVVEPPRGRIRRPLSGAGGIEPFRGRRTL
jgi:hypothetical protein